MSDRLPSRENAETKGRRYVAEGRLLVQHVDERSIRAACRGGGGNCTNSAMTEQPGFAAAPLSGAAPT